MGGNLKYRQTCIKRSPLGQRRKNHFKTGKGSIHMKFPMTGQEKGDLTIQVIAY